MSCRMCSGRRTIPFNQNKGIGHIQLLLIPILWTVYPWTLRSCPLVIEGIITKLPESGVLCDNITEFGVAEDHLSP